jgi:hypothetical protein
MSINSLSEKQLNKRLVNKMAGVPGKKLLKKRFDTIGL